MKIRNIVIVGGGMMGKGIAQVFSRLLGISVTIHDTKAVDADVLGDIQQELEAFQQRGIVSGSAAQMTRIAFTADPEDPCFAQADFVIECVFEDMALKQNLFADLEQKCRPDTIFATNTSVMSPTEISSKLQHKERLVGTHFWNPAFLIPLVEVVKSDHTSGEVMDAAMQLMAECGKKPVRCNRDVPGFIANRLQHALWREAFHMVQEGIADAKTVDDACKYGPGLRWPVLGPMENSDMVGIPLTWNIHEYILPHLADNHQPSPQLNEMLERGDQGFGTGKGWQEWTAEQMAASRAGLREYLIDRIAKNKSKD